MLRAVFFALLLALSLSFSEQNLKVERLGEGYFVVVKDFGTKTLIELLKAEGGKIELLDVIYLNERFLDRTVEVERFRVREK